MSRRRRRERPATPEEQAQIERFSELARAALEIPPGAVQRAALARMRRAGDRIRDPGNLSNVPRRELVEAAEHLLQVSRTEVRDDVNEQASP